ncbi:MAG: NAD(P)H-dependent oxidoreductase [Candidatus Bathyarchaeota archaeon]|nr:NAD(P)H-dependent oxidoreductase [Candidatus Bathyarchaeota archaeon]
MKTLVTYYSKTGNTKYVAQKIADQLNAEMSEIRDKKNRKGKLNFVKSGYESIREKLTEIEVTKKIDEYDFVIVGSPVWAGKIPPAIRTFLVKNDFGTKKIAFFVTVGGDKPEKALNAMKEIISPQNPVSELAITEAMKNIEEINSKISDWCNKLGL